jgi:hypothetical protein
MSRRLNKPGFSGHGHTFPPLTRHKFDATRQGKGDEFVALTELRMGMPSKSPRAKIAVPAPRTRKVGLESVVVQIKCFHWQAGIFKCLKC